MSKHKGKSQKKTAQSALALKTNGLRAFQSADYDKAIASWEKIPNAMRPKTALAEAYFRRGVRRLYEMNASAAPGGLNDLKSACACSPDDACYAHHLGIALHRANDMEGALKAYRVALAAGGPFAERAAYPYALALFQQGQDAAADPIWAALTADEQAMLRSANVFRRRPYSLSPEAPLLWRSLAALDAGSREQAAADLQQVVDSAAAPSEKALAYFYLGGLVAQAEDWPAARSAWQAAYAAGLRGPRLKHNLAESFERLAEESLAQNDPQVALAALQEAQRHSVQPEALNELKAGIYQALGYQAATANRWDKALTDWQSVAQLDEGSFRLAYNLALAYEKLENYQAAGETWREALRRRPRRSDHPDALSDEQVARLWQHTAECYRKGGDLDEAIRVYQQAIKWNPDNLEVRQALAEGLLADERLDAARNELERILDRNAEYIPALLRLGEVHFRNDQWWIRNGAVHYWERALKLQPDHLTARQLLADYYRDQAEIDYSWDKSTEAIRDYQKALEYQPADAWTHAAIAHCYILLDDLAQAQIFIEKALQLAPAMLKVYDEILTAWIVTHQPERAWQVVAQAEAAVEHITVDFYISNAEYCLHNDEEEQAPAWLERAAARARPQDNVYVMIGEMLMQHDDSLARQYLERAITAGQFPGQAHLLLALLAHKRGDNKACSRHLKEAEAIARRMKDEELAMRVEMAHVMFSGPQGLLQRFVRLGPMGLSNLLGDFEDEDDG